MTVTHISDAERAAQATITRLQGEALVLRELLRRALEPIMTIDDPESSEESHLLCQLIDDMQRAIAPHQVSDIVQKGMF